MNTAETISIQDDTQEITLSKAYEARLVSDGIIYACEDCGGAYHLKDEHTWQSLAAALSQLQNDFAVSAPIQ